MSTDLHGLLKLVHELTGFLLRLSADQLAGIAEGRLPLAVGVVGEAVHQPATVQQSAVPIAVPRVDAAPVVAKRRQRAAPGDAAADYAEIAAMLRKQETTNDGFAYLDSVRLHGKKLVKNDLLALGPELNLELPSSLLVPKIRARLVEQAIGARKKYEGLRP